jgi:hypothetical protein
LRRLCRVKELFEPICETATTWISLRCSHHSPWNFATQALHFTKRGGCSSDGHRAKESDVRQGESL